jgi:hypothetical protein
LLISFQQQVTPELGLNSTREKRVPSDRLRYDSQHNFSQSKLPTAATSLQYLIPHAPITPKEVFPFSSQQSLSCPTSLSGLLDNRSDMKSMSPETNAQRTREQFPTKLSPGEYAHGLGNLLLQQQISHPERLLTGLTTLFFNKKYLTQRDFSWA